MVDTVGHSLDHLSWSHLPQRMRLHEGNQYSKSEINRFAMYIVYVMNVAFSLGYLDKLCPDLGSLLPHHQPGCLWVLHCQVQLWKLRLGLCYGHLWGEQWRHFQMWPHQVTSCRNPVGLASGAVIYLIGVTIPFIILLLSHIALEIYFIRKKVCCESFSIVMLFQFLKANICTPQPDFSFPEPTGNTPNNPKKSNDACAPLSHLRHFHWRPLSRGAGHAGQQNLGSIISTAKRCS